MKIIILVIAIFSIALLSVTSKKDKKEKFKNDYTYIPSGTFEFEKKQVSVNAFYMLSTEVSNKQYLEFVNDLKSKGSTKDYLLALPDSMGWRKPYAYNGPYVEYYFRHPAYANYPVVNVTREGVNLYCKWLTNKMRIKYPKQNFNDFRIPSKEEWVYAAKAGLKHSPYPWGGPFTRNTSGNYLANFLRIGENNIKRDSLGKIVITNGDEFSGAHLDRGVDITAPVNSYNPNGYGLYNMAGNVAELIANDTLAMGGSWKSPGYDIRVTSQEPATKPKPTIGFRVVCTHSPH